MCIRDSYNTGGTLRLNNVHGSAELGIGNTVIASLRNQRQGGTQSTAAGKEIGLARIYDFALESGSYNATNGDVNEFDISLYDIQTFTEVTLNTNHTLSTPVFVEGKFSGATGFLRSAVSNSTSLTLYETQGDIIPNEPLIFNGVENTRVALAITSFGMSDVKAIFGGPGLTDQNTGDVGFAKTFQGDIVQKDQFVFGSANMTSATGSGSVSISTITSGNPQFPGKLKVGSILKFGGLGNNLKSLVRITSVGTENVIVTGVTTVTGVTEGALYKGTANTSLEVPDLTLVSTPFEKSNDNTLFTEMPKDNISDVDISSATLNIRKLFDVVIDASNDQLSSAVSAGTNETFLPFDEERYSLIRSDGTIEVLTSDKFTFTAGNGSVQIGNIGSDLTANQEATLIATLAKTSPKAKVKRKERVNSITVTKSKIEGSGTGLTTLNDGLEFGSFPFGTRVQDKKISLNTPDVLDVLGIFESTTTSDASAPKITLSSIDSAAGKTTDMIIGEKISGNSSNAVGVYAERISDTQISFIPLNGNEFREWNGQALITSLKDQSLRKLDFKDKKEVKEEIIFKGDIGRIRDIQIHPINGKIFFLAGDYLWLMEKNF